MNKMIVAVFCIMLVTGLHGQEMEEANPEELPAAPETLTVELMFKDINVFEYDLDLIFMDEDSNEVWFNEMSIDSSDIVLYTIEDNEGFPLYTVNEDNIGTMYRITYVEREVLGDVSDEPTQIKHILAMEEVSQN